MNAKGIRTLLVLLLLLAVAFHLPAQQAEADRKLFESTKTKAQAGDADAQFSLGFMYGVGKGVPRDNTEAVKWFRKAAEQGIALGQCALGAMYTDGVGVTKDYTEAVKWYRKAAEQGLALAQNYLGLMYENGNGVPKDLQEAAKWYRKAADQGLAVAELSLSKMYSKGEGLPHDSEEAVKWLRKAADNGLADAQFALGFILVPEDSREAVEWFRKAAEQGLAVAQFELGRMYGRGNGVSQNSQEAVKWYRKAAVQGHVEAQLAIGLMFIGGYGVPQDYVEAHKWLNLSAAQGNENAKTSLRVVERRMTVSQIAEAQQLAREFKRREGPEPDVGFPHEAVKDLGPAASGTGFFITDDGYLISNNHVVKDAAKIRLVTSVGLIDAKVVRVDAANDLALLKAEGRFAPLPIAASRTVKLGGTVATVGFPNIGLQGFSPKLAKGEIASLSGSQDDPRYFQISVPVQPGNSGGALVDEHGNVIGIVSAKLDASVALATSGALPENVNYAVKSSFLLSFLESMPAVSAKLKEPITADRKFEDVVKSAQDAAVLVLVY